MATLLVVGVFACKETVKKSVSVKEDPVTPAVTYHYPSFCSYFPPPAGTPTFALSQNYPQSFDKTTFKEPWKAVDFKTDYKKYMQVLLDYCMEGNLAVDFKGQDNAVRTWYNAPWLDNDGHNPANPNDAQNSGREYHHGLTREITISAGTLGPKQVEDYQTWAVAYYNEPGGYTVGRVWANPNAPDKSLADFPEGTVCFKLLLTETPVAEAPYLENSLTWTANIFVPAHEKQQRFDKTVRLVQLDVSVKDERAETGWVYGTFVHNAAAGGAPADWVSRLVPVGLMWGDDPTDTTMLNVTNKINPSLKQSVINAELLRSNDNNIADNAVFITHLGQGGRMNGPVDNPISSCMSCHSRAAIDDVGNMASIANFSTPAYTLADFEEYFSEVPCGIQTIEQPQSDGTMKSYQTLDFSFQVGNGLRNYYQVMHPDNDFKMLVLRDGRSIDPDK